MPGFAPVGALPVAGLPNASTPAALPTINSLLPDRAGTASRYVALIAQASLTLSFIPLIPPPVQPPPLARLPERIPPINPWAALTAQSSLVRPPPSVVPIPPTLQSRAPLITRVGSATRTSDWWGASPLGLSASVSLPFVQSIGDPLPCARLDRLGGQFSGTPLALAFSIADDGNITILW